MTTIEQPAPDAPAPIGPRLATIPGPNGINRLVLVRPAPRRYLQPPDPLPKRREWTPPPLPPRAEPWLRPADADGDARFSTPGDDPGPARLVALRRAAGLTQRQLAEYTRTSRGGIAMAETGARGQAMRGHLCSWLEGYCAEHGLEVPA